MSRTVVAAQFGAPLDCTIPRILSAAGLLEHLHADICPAKGWSHLLRALHRAMLRASICRLVDGMPWRVPPAFGLRYAIRRYAAVSSRPRSRCRAGRFQQCGIEQLRGASQAGSRTAVEQIVAARSISRLVSRGGAFGLPRLAGILSWPMVIPPRSPHGAAEAELADVVLCGSEFTRQSATVSGGRQRLLLIVHRRRKLARLTPRRHANDIPAFQTKSFGNTSRLDRTIRLPFRCPAYRSARPERSRSSPQHGGECRPQQHSRASDRRLPWNRRKTNSCQSNLGRRDPGRPDGRDQRAALGAGLPDLR